MEGHPQTAILFRSFPRTQPPPFFVADLIDVFSKHEGQISTKRLTKGLTSDSVLATLRPDLKALGFQVEEGKLKAQKIDRPVFFGENGKPTLNFQIDGFHSKWECGLEIEAGRALMGNAIYRDLIRASVMVELKYLVLAVPLTYKYQSQGKTHVGKDYEETSGLAETLYGHSRLRLPYDLVVVGY